MICGALFCFNINLAVVLFNATWKKVVDEKISGTTGFLSTHV